MAKPFPLKVPPGVLKYESAISTGGRYIDAQNVRFWHGKAEKMGGWTSLLTAALVGEPQALFAWNDLTIRNWVAAGTNKKLYAFADTDWTPNDLTPIVSTQTGVASPLATTNGSSTVTVSWTGHNASVGQEVIIASASAIGGITPNGTFTITNVVDVNHFQFSFTSNATSTVAAGGGTPTFGLVLAPGSSDPAGGTGWGAGTWGAEAWGTARSVATITMNPRNWSLQNFGKILLAAASGVGTLYSWDPTNLPVQRAAAVSNAPTVMSGFYVSAERVVFAYGTNSLGTQDLMEFWTCGQGDYTDWTLGNSVSTQGGVPSISRRLTNGTRIMAGGDVGNNVNLMWTDTALYLNQYNGQATAYNTRLVGTNCGLVAPKGYVIQGGKAYWISVNGFKQYDGGSVVDIPNSTDVSQWLFDQARAAYLIKSFAYFNPLFSEVVFCFVQDNDTTPSLEAVYSLNDQTWTVNTRARTAGCYLAGNTGKPLLADAQGAVYKHEDGHDGNGSAAPWSLTMGPIEIADGEASYDVWKLYVDMVRQVGNISVSLTAYDRSPASATVVETATGTFAPTDGTCDLTHPLQGRQVALSLSGGTALGDDFRLGILKLDITMAGLRD